jgi:PIN domain nuclease of toxin-antitoxin system
MRKSEEVANRIADEVLNIETLETQQSDELDFHDVSVWELKRALEAAYIEGLEDGRGR